MWHEMGDVSDWWKDIAINCVPFTVEPTDMPYTARYALLKDQATQQFIPLANSPQMIVTGKQVGYAGSSPIEVRETFSPTTSNTPITVSLPEGSYQFTALACKYDPKADVFMRGRGDGGLTTIYLNPTIFAGPGVLGANATKNTYLAAYNKIGPFLSFVGPNGTVLPGAPNVPVTFNIDVPTPPIAAVPQVSVTIAGVQKAAPASNGHASVQWNMSEIPAGEIKMYVQAYGHYIQSGNCGQGDNWGPIYEKVILMAPAPPWLYNDTWVSVTPAELTYNSAAGQYNLHGQLKGSVDKYDNTGVVKISPL